MSSKGSCCYCGAKRDDIVNVLHTPSFCSQGCTDAWEKTKKTTPFLAKLSEAQRSKNSNDKARLDQAYISGTLLNEYGI